MQSVLTHVGWECTDQPLEDETQYYLSWVLEHVSYVELLLASRLWRSGCYTHLCVGCMEGTT